MLQRFPAACRAAVVRGFHLPIPRNWVVCEIRILSRPHVLTLQNTELDNVPRHHIFLIDAGEDEFGRP